MVWWKSLIKYFDLNERARQGELKYQKRIKKPHTWDRIGFVLKRPEFLSKEFSIIEQIIMYLGVLIGVIFSTGLERFEEGTFNIFDLFSINYFIFSAVLSLVIIPQIYEKLNLKQRAPFIVQFGIFVQNGFFWHVIISSVGNIL